MNTATQVQGAANPDVKIGEVVVKPNPRQVAIDAMTARMEHQRETEQIEDAAADPGLAHNQDAINREIQESNAAAIAAGTLQPSDPNDGAASRIPMHPEQAAPVADPLPAEIAADPLSEYIVMENGQPMFQAKVNGETKLIPLEQARRQIQIGTAAEVRMQQAAAFEQSTTHTLDERERGIAIREAALAQRTAAAPAPVPAKADLTYEDLLDETREIFSTAFSGTEEDAAKKLATTLLKIRAPTAMSAVPIDERAIVSKAARAAVTAVQNVGKKQDVQDGYTQFKLDYPELMDDPILYKMADGMTDGIEQEHPDWKISQVMAEAGKRTRAWVNKVKGVEPDPVPTPGTTNTPAPTQHPTQNRQERKAELVRMPTAAASAVHQAPADVPEEDQTPAEAFAELKSSRGQPT